MTQDPYAALGLTKSASQDEIKAAYRKIARTSHPDLNPDDPTAEARFKAAGAAYDLLKDPETRARFDRGEIDATGAERAERRYYRDFAEDAGNPYWRHGTGGGTGPGGEAFEFTFDDTGQAGDIFEEMLRRYGGRQAGPGAGMGGAGFAARGADRRYALEVSFMDAARGGKTRITLPEGGTLEVRIPEGVADGQTIRLRGKGGAGIGGGPAGDALVTLSVAPHKLFRRDGDDILLTLPITLDEAVLGGKVEAPTIDGPVNLTIPKGASGGQVMRLRGRGIKRRSGDGRGDQLVELRIVLPDTIDDPLAEFLETWRGSHRYDPRKGMSP